MEYSYQNLIFILILLLLCTFTLVDISVSDIGHTTISDIKHGIVNFTQKHSWCQSCDYLLVTYTLTISQEFLFKMSEYINLEMIGEPPPQ